MFPFGHVFRHSAHMLQYWLRSIVPGYSSQGHPKPADEPFRHSFAFAPQWARQTSGSTARTSRGAVPAYAPMKPPMGQT